MGLFALLLHLGLPSDFGFWILADRVWLGAIALLSLFLSFRQTHRLEPYLSFSVALLLFGLPLAAIWSTGTTSLAAIGGILPWSDAVKYVRIGHRLLDAGFIDLGFSRPFFPGFLAVLLDITGRDLMAVQAMLTAAPAIACYLTSREIRRTLGALPAALVLASLLLFYSHFIGALMTESLGLILGTLGFAVLWRGGVQRREDLLLLGIFLVTLGLCARMAAIGVLPLLLLWGTLLMARQGGKPGLFLLKGSGLILLGFALNSLLSRLISGGNYMSFGNYSYVLYGLLTGGNWQSVLKDHPEIASLPGAQQVQEIYRLCLEIIRSDPMSLVSGVLRSWDAMLKQGSARLIPPLIPWISLQTWLHYLIRPLLAIGLGIALIGGRVNRPWLKRFTPLQTRSPVYGLLLAYIGGTLLSAPFAPLWDGGWRPYAVTLVGCYAVVGLGVWAVLQGGQDLIRAVFRQPAAAEKPQEEAMSLASQGWESYSTAAVLGWLLTGVIIFGPLWVMATAKVPTMGPKPCPADMETAFVYIHPHVALHLQRDNDLARTHLPQVRLSDFRQGLQPLEKSQPALVNALGQLEPGQTLLSSLLTKSRLILIDTPLMPAQAGPYFACGRVEPFPGPPSPERTFLRVSAFHPPRFPQS